MSTLPLPLLLLLLLEPEPRWKRAMFVSRSRFLCVARCRFISLEILSGRVIVGWQSSIEFPLPPSYLPISIGRSS